MAYTFEDDTKGGFKILNDGDEVITLSQDEVSTRVVTEVDREYVMLTNGKDYNQSLYENDIAGADSTQDILDAIDAARADDTSSGGGGGINSAAIQEIEVVSGDFTGNNYTNAAINGKTIEVFVGGTKLVRGTEFTHAGSILTIPSGPTDCTIVFIQTT